MSRSVISRARLGVLPAVAIAIAACAATTTQSTATPAAVVAPAQAQPTAAPTATARPTARPSTSRAPDPAPGYATPPPGWPTPAVLVPTKPLPKPSGSPLPADLIGREYNTDPISTQGIQAEVLTLRSADDPHCMAMFHGSSTCFTILWTPNYPKHIDDPAVRGPARIVDGKLVLDFALVPNGPECEGLIVRYSISADGWTLAALDAQNCSYPRFVRH